MFTALVQDRVDFVQLFMENGVSIKKFLSIETLWNLYANVSLVPKLYGKICVKQPLKSRQNKDLNEKW